VYIKGLLRCANISLTYVNTDISHDSAISQDYLLTCKITDALRGNALLDISTIGFGAFIAHTFAALAQPVSVAMGADIWQRAFLNLFCFERIRESIPAPYATHDRLFSAICALERAKQSQPQQ
jgi:hypothetical protein